MDEKLSKETAQLVTPLFIEPASNDFYGDMFYELKATDPVLADVIRIEALRLFNNDAELRARATRFVLEILHIRQVSKLEAQFNDSYY